MSTFPTEYTPYWTILRSIFSTKIYEKRKINVGFKQLEVT